jgi:hypothetical protein
MNLDELVNSIPNNEPEHKKSLRKWVDDWKKNDKNVNDLKMLIGKWHGNVWFKDESFSNEFHKNFLDFTEKAIIGIGGMTMSERLYWFGLIDIWDSSNSETQSLIRKKLEAN